MRNSKCGSAPYGRSSFYNSSNYKKQSYRHKIRPKKPTKKDLKYQQHLESKKVKATALPKIRSRSSDCKSNLSFSFKLKHIQLNEIQHPPRLSLVLQDQAITPESNVYVFKKDTSDHNPYVLWIINNLEVQTDIPKALGEISFKKLLKGTFSLDPHQFSELSQTIKGFRKIGPSTTKFLKCKVKDDPVLVKVLHSFGQFQLCSKELTKANKSSGWFLVEQLG